MEVLFRNVPASTLRLKLSYLGYYSKMSVTGFAIDILQVTSPKPMWDNIFDTGKGRTFDHTWSTESYPPEFLQLYRAKDGLVTFRLRLSDIGENVAQELDLDLFDLQAFA